MVRRSGSPPIRPRQAARSASWTGRSSRSSSTPLWMTRSLPLGIPVAASRAATGSLRATTRAATRPASQFSARTVRGQDRRVKIAGTGSLPVRPSQVKASRSRAPWASTRSTGYSPSSRRSTAALANRPPRASGTGYTSSAPAIASASTGEPGGQTNRTCSPRSCRPSASRSTEFTEPAPPPWCSDTSTRSGASPGPATGSAFALSIRILIVGAGGADRTEQALARAARALGHDARVLDALGWRRRLGGWGGAVLRWQADRYRPEFVLCTRHTAAAVERALRHLTRGRPSAFWYFDAVAPLPERVILLGRQVDQLFATYGYQVDAF